MDCDFYIAKLETIYRVQKKPQAHFKMLLQNLYTNHVYLIYIDRHDLTLDTL